MTESQPVFSRRVCVIGAGPCGLTSIRNLLAEGIQNIVCYDEGEGLGGNWRFDERAARASVYDSVHLISSKHLSGFDDFPMPDTYPDFPSHRQMLAYFEAYAEKFALKGHIVFGARVERVERLTDGQWTVTVARNGKTTMERFDAVLVAAGHHRDPFVPAYPGTFSGEMLHSRDYRRPERFAGKRVLVVGGGNSACDIAADIARVAKSTALSFRRPHYIIPKILFGRPIDVLYNRLRRKARLPRWLFERALGFLLRVGIGPYEKYGLPQPMHGPLKSHPTLNTAILTALRDGDVAPRRGIARLDGQNVVFEDGEAEIFDVIIWGTGFKTSFPFLSPDVVDWPEDAAPPLYLRMMHAKLPTLFFIGLFQPVGCIWRMADYQARLAAKQLAGRMARPTDIAAKIDRELAEARARYDTSRRHLLEVDGYDFRRRLIGELKSAA